MSVCGYKPKFAAPRQFVCSSPDSRRWRREALHPDAKHGGAAVPEGSTAGMPMAQGTRSPAVLVTASAAVASNRPAP